MLELIAPFTQISDQLIGFCAGSRWGRVGFAFEGCQSGIHFIKPFLGPRKVRMKYSLALVNHLGPRSRELALDFLFRLKPCRVKVTSGQFC